MRSNTTAFHSQFQSQFQLWIRRRLLGYRNRHVGRLVEHADQAERPDHLQHRLGHGDLRLRVAAVKARPAGSLKGAAAGTLAAVTLE